MKLEKRPSEIDGWGVITTRPIREGTVFYVIPTETTHTKPVARCARIADDLYVDDDEVLNWVNHSCDPSCRLDIENEPNLVALRNITAGDEITVNYNETEVQGVAVICSCGAENCKGVFNRL